MTHISKAKQLRVIKLAHLFIDSFLNSGNRKRRIYIGPTDNYSFVPEGYFPHLNILIEMARALGRLDEDANNPGTVILLPRQPTKINK